MYTYKKRNNLFMLNKLWLKAKLLDIGGKTQKELAKHMGLGERDATISDMIAGKRNPTLDEAILMADFLQCSFDEVLRKGFGIPEEAIRSDYNKMPQNNTINLSVLQDATIMVSQLAKTYELSKEDIRKISKKVAEALAFLGYQKVSENLVIYIIEQSK